MARRQGGLSSSRSGLVAFDIDLDSALNSSSANTSFCSSSYKSSPNTSFDSCKSSGSYTLNNNNSFDSSYQPFKSSLKSTKPAFAERIDSVYSTIEQSQRALDNLIPTRNPSVVVDEASAYRPEPGGLPLIVKPLRGQIRDPTVPTTTVPIITNAAPTIVRRRTITEDPVRKESGYGTLGRSRPVDYGSPRDYKSAYSAPKTEDYGTYRSRIADDYGTFGKDYGSSTLTRSKPWYSSSVDGPPAPGTLPRSRKPDPEPIPFIDDELPASYRAPLPAAPAPPLSEPPRFSRICLVKEDHIVEVGDRKPEISRPEPEPPSVRSWKPLSLEETRNEVVRDVERHGTLDRPKKIESVKPWSSRVTDSIPHPPTPLDPTRGSWDTRAEPKESGYNKWTRPEEYSYKSTVASPPAISRSSSRVSEASAGTRHWESSPVTRSSSRVSEASGATKPWESSTISRSSSRVSESDGFGAGAKPFEPLSQLAHDTSSNAGKKCCTPVVPSVIRRPSVKDNGELMMKLDERRREANESTLQRKIDRRPSIVRDSEGSTTIERRSSMSSRRVDERAMKKESGAFKSSVLREEPEIPAPPISRANKTFAQRLQEELNEEDSDGDFSEDEFERAIEEKLRKRVDQHWRGESQDSGYRSVRGGGGEMDEDEEEILLDWGEPRR